MGHKETFVAELLTYNTEVTIDLVMGLDESLVAKQYQEVLKLSSNASRYKYIHTIFPNQALSSTLISIKLCAIPWVHIS